MGPEKTDDFSKDSTVDITVWKTLWRMWKALDYEPFMKVTIRLWVILRNNIYGKNQISQRKKTGKEGGPARPESIFAVRAGKRRRLRDVSFKSMTARRGARREMEGGSP